MRRVVTLAILGVLALDATAPADTAFETALKQARLALDTGRPADAAPLYEKAVAVSPSRASRLAPERAWAYVKLGNKALKSSDYARAEEYFSLVSAIHPDFKEIVAPQWAFVKLYLVNEAVNAAIENRQEADWETLALEVRRAMQISPNDRQAYFTLGVLHEIQRKNEEAKKYYLKALAGRRKGPGRSLEALRKTAEQEVSRKQHTFNLRPVFPPWRETDGDTLQTLKKGPFVIHHYREALAERVAAVLTYHLQRDALGGVLEAGGPFPEVCNVFIFGSEEDFQNSGGNQVWAGGQAKLFALDDKLVGTQIHFFQTVPDLTESAVPHELAHVRLLAAAPFLEGLPLWLQEGVATSTESEYAKQVHAKRLAEAKGTLIPFEKMLDAETYPGGPTNSLFYSECVAVVESLVERYGKDRFWQFVEAIAALGQRDALRDVYGLSPTELEGFIPAWSAAHQ